MRAIPDSDFRERRIGYCLLAGLFSLFAATMVATDFTEFDGVVRFGVLRSVLEEGASIDSRLGGWFPVGASIAMAPLFLLGRLIGHYAAMPSIDFAKETCL